MKHILQTYILFVCAILLLSCNDDEQEPVYMTKFYDLHWDVDTMPLILPSSALNQTFEIKDRYNYPGGIKGVPGMFASSQQDTIRIENTGLNSELKNSILSDTIRGSWFTVITEEERRVRVILNKNEETATRCLAIAVWAYQLQNIHDGVPMCDQLVIYQLPSKKE